MRRHPILWATLTSALVLVLANAYIPSGKRAYAVAGVIVLLIGALLYAHRAQRGLWKATAVAVAVLGLLANQVGVELASLLFTVPLAFCALALSLRSERRRALLQYIFFCRFPILHGLFLLVLASIGISGQPEGLATLLSNLFEVRFRGLWLVIFLGALTGAVVASSGRLLTRSSAPWIDGQPLTGSWVTLGWAAFGAAGPLAIAVAMLLRSPLESWRALAAIACGAACAAAVLLIGHIVAHLLTPPAKVEGPLPIRWAALHDVAPATKLVQSVETSLLHAPGPLVRGYISQQGHLEAGHLAAFTTAALILVLYVLGFRVLDPGGSFEPPALSYILLLILVTASLLPLISFFLDRFRVPTSLALTSSRR